MTVGISLAGGGVIGGGGGELVGVMSGAGVGGATATSSMAEQQISTPRRRRTNILSAVGEAFDERADRIVRLVRPFDHREMAGFP